MSECAWRSDGFSRLAIPPPHLVSPPPPACHRSASRSWTGAPGPPCTDLPPSAPGSGRAAARCIRNPLCQETSERTEAETGVSEWVCGACVGGCLGLQLVSEPTGGAGKHVFYESAPALYGWLCC